ncbi:MAG: helix-turn-helix domain-containing protein [archaeon]
MQDNCSIFKTADFVGKRWTLLILLELFKGQTKSKRFSELKKSLPNITPKILSARLKELEKQKMVSKKVDSSTVPIKSEYSLTESGDDFIKVIKGIKKWSIKWKKHCPECETRNCKYCEF